MIGADSMSHAVSSTQYRFSYHARSDEDIPDDFLIADKDLDFESAIFIPQDHSSWPQRESSHPPRIFFLMRDCMKIYTHPAAGQAVVVIRLDDLEIVELGRFLLISWMKFFTPTASHTFFFSSVDGRIVGRLLKELRYIWLPCPTSVSVCLNRIETSGDQMTFKFQQRLQEELDPGETPQESLLLAHPNIRAKRYWFRGMAYVPGDLLTVTSKRILWITDDDPGGGGREVYGSVARYAPIGNVQKLSVDDRNLLIAFHAGRSWSISLR
jgi:hypothetical protein